MRVALIAALSANNVIGRNGALPWRLPADLKFFKRMTTGHHLIMGRKTYESVGKLPGRKTVVITRDTSINDPDVIAVRTVDEALEAAAGDEMPFIGGGAQIYVAAMHRVDVMYLTRIHAEFDGDTFFPEFDDVNEWRLVDAEHHEADEKNAWPYSFLTYERATDGTKPEADIAG